jgi:hypothetical protein
MYAQDTVIRHEMGPPVVDLGYGLYRATVNVCTFVGRQNSLR